MRRISHCRIAKVEQMTRGKKVEIQNLRKSQIMVQIGKTMVVALVDLSKIQQILSEMYLVVKIQRLMENIWNIQLMN